MTFTIPNSFSATAAVTATLCLASSMASRPQQRLPSAHSIKVMIPLFRQILEPTVPLARHIFRTPTYYYKTGLTFLAYLNGHQDHFRMVGGLESGRSVIHLCELLVLADRAGVIRDPHLAIERMRRFLAANGIG